MKMLLAVALVMSAVSAFAGNCNVTINETIKLPKFGGPIELGGISLSIKGAELLKVKGSKKQQKAIAKANAAESRIAAGTTVEANIVKVNGQVRYLRVENSRIQYILVDTTMKGMTSHDVNVASEGKLSISCPQI